jgi:hypothetical protein
METTVAILNSLRWFLPLSSLHPLTLFSGHAGAVRQRVDWFLARRQADGVYHGIEEKSGQLSAFSQKEFIKFRFYLNPP